MVLLASEKRWRRCKECEVGDLPKFDLIRGERASTPEVHERPQATQRIDSIEALDHIMLEAYMPRDFALTSARTRRLQSGLLVALLLVLVAILAQEIRSPMWPRQTQEARESRTLATGSISRPDAQTVNNQDVPADRPPFIVWP
jgi:hypothetical protein